MIGGEYTMQLLINQVAELREQNRRLQVQVDWLCRSYAESLVKDAERVQKEMNSGGGE